MESDNRIFVYISRRQTQSNSFTAFSFAWQPSECVFFWNFVRCDRFVFRIRSSSVTVRLDLFRLIFLCRAHCPSRSHTITTMCDERNNTHFSPLNTNYPNSLEFHMNLCMYCGPYCSHNMHTSALAYGEQEGESLLSNMRAIGDDECVAHTRLHCLWCVEWAKIRHWLRVWVWVGMRDTRSECDWQTQQTRAQHSLLRVCVCVFSSRSPFDWHFRCDSSKKLNVNALSLCAACARTQRSRAALLRSLRQYHRGHESRVG